MAGEKAQWLGAHAPLEEDPSLSLRVYVRWLTTPGSLASRDITPSSGLCWQLHSCANTTSPHTHNEK